MPTKLWIIGAGGHAKVVVSTQWPNKADVNISIFDSNPEKSGTILLGYPISDGFESDDIDAFHIAIGDNRTRFLLYEQFKNQAKFQTIVSSSSHIYPQVELADGVFVASGAIIGPEAKVGRGSIINHGAIVDHDSTIGEFCHIAPNASLSGGVVIGHHTLIGAGAVVLPGIRIADGAVVGSGAVVTKNLEYGQVYIGAPARAKHNRYEQ